MTSMTEEGNAMFGRPDKKQVQLTNKYNEMAERVMEAQKREAEARVKEKKAQERIMALEKELRDKELSKDNELRDNEDVHEESDDEPQGVLKVNDLVGTGNTQPAAQAASAVSTEPGHDASVEPQMSQDDQVDRKKKTVALHYTEIRKFATGNSISGTPYNDFSESFGIIQALLDQKNEIFSLAQELISQNNETEKRLRDSEANNAVLLQKISDNEKSIDEHKEREHGLEMELSQTNSKLKMVSLILNEQ